MNSPLTNSPIQYFSIRVFHALWFPASGYMVPHSTVRESLGFPSGFFVPTFPTPYPCPFVSFELEKPHASDRPTGAWVV